MLCSVVKHLGSGRTLKKWGKHFFPTLPLPACFATEQSTVEASLFVKQNETIVANVMITSTQQSKLKLDNSN